MKNIDEKLHEYRKSVYEKIEKLEKLGGENFSKDVEEDPPTETILPNQIDYTQKKLSTKILCSISNFLGRRFFDGEIKKGQLRIKNICGFENYKKVEDCGVIITCNHFNVCDHYIVYKSIQKSLKKQHKDLFKIIKEGNYTSVKGLFGFLLRHCNTLPLSSNRDTMKKFISSTSELLKRKEKILAYPEQAMWWNYKKPRPLQNGSYHLAVKNNVPILPVFITMEDSKIIGKDGFPVQDYTIFFEEPIYLDKNLNKKQNIEYLKNKNFEVWKKVYEDFYKKPLTYTCEN